MKKLILIVLLINISCTNHNRLIKDETRIENFLINQEKDSFNLVLDTISSFQWDELLIAGPYTDLDIISDYDLNKIPNTIKHHDNFILIGFIYKKTGMKYMEFDRHLLSDYLFENKNYDYKIYPKSKCNFLIIKK